MFVQNAKTACGKEIKCAFAACLAVKDDGHFSSCSPESAENLMFVARREGGQQPANQCYGRKRHYDPVLC